MSWRMEEELKQGGEEKMRMERKATTARDVGIYGTREEEDGSESGKRPMKKIERFRRTDVVFVGPWSNMRRNTFSLIS